MKIVKKNLKQQSMAIAGAFVLHVDQLQKFPMLQDYAKNVIANLKQRKTTRGRSVLNVKNSVAMTKAKFYAKYAARVLIVKTIHGKDVLNAHQPKSRKEKKRLNAQHVVVTFVV